MPGRFIERLGESNCRYYDTETKLLKRQVRRNIDRFTEDFMFQLNSKELKELVPNWHQFKSYKHSSVNPFAFTEQGIAMLSSVLRSKKAVKVNIEIMRAFVELRKHVLQYEDILKKLDKLEEKTDNKLFEHDNQIKIIFETIKKMMLEDIESNSRKIGFNVEE